MPSARRPVRRRTGSHPTRRWLGARVRAAIDFGDAADLADKAGLAAKALTGGGAEMLKILRARGVFIGHGPAPKVAFLYTGQGSQYVNMLAGLASTEPIVAQTFAEADEIMTPLLGKPLTDYIFVDRADEAAVARPKGSCCRPRSPSPRCSPPTSP